MRLIFVFILATVFNCCHGQELADSLFSHCAEKLRVNCRTEELEFLPIKKKLIRKDINCLKRIFQLVNTRDTSVRAVLSQDAKIFLEERMAVKDNLYKVESIDLNYFRVYASTFITKESIIRKFSINNSWTMGCKGSGGQSGIFDNRLFSMYLKNHISLKYYYYCGHINLIYDCIEKTSSGMKYITCPIIESRVRNH